jgi:hypothetical protein
VFFDFLGYVAELGKPLPKGDTVGRTADERLPVFNQNDRGKHFVIAMDSADWYCRVASKLEDQHQAVVAGTARRLLHFQEHSRRKVVHTRVVSIEAPGTNYGLSSRDKLE